MYRKPVPKRPNGPQGFAFYSAICDRALVFSSTDGRAFATIRSPENRGFVCHPVRSRAFRDWFFRLADDEYDTIPTSQAWNSILRHLEAQASRNPDIHVPRRVDQRGPASAPSHVMINLANPRGEFVEISPGQWSVTTSRSVPFETSPSTDLPNPEPASPDAPQSPLDTLRSTLNLGPPAGSNWLRCLAWLLAALRANGPFPILILRGPSGSDKTFAARMLRAMIDPVASPFTPLPRGAAQLLTLARQNWVLAFDHVSSLTPQLSETLCRLTSGVGLAYREEGSREIVQQFIKHPILLTVTGDFEAPPELADRAFFVTLPELPDSARLPDEFLVDTIDAVYPQILGALCTPIAQVLANPPQIAACATRHAGALAWAIAAAPVLGCAPDQIRAAFDEPPPLPPIVHAVQGLLTPSPSWTGTAHHLVKELRIGPTPRALSARLRDAVLPLADAGIAIDFQRGPGGSRVIALFATQNSGPPPQPPPRELLPGTQILRPFPSGKETGDDPCGLTAP